MGNFYANVTLLGPDHARVAAMVRELGYHAYVSTTTSGLTVVCEEQSDLQDDQVLRDVARGLSAHLECSALAVLNHDDDILFYLLYRNGRLVDEYDSCPGYFTGQPIPPNGGKAELLVKTFGMPGDPEQAEEILRTGSTRAKDGFVFASDRHRALLEALDWPEIPAMFGFNYVVEEYEEGAWEEV